MINREHVVTLLKINGISPDSPDEYIRSVLLSARYTKDEIDTAIMVLRENTRTKQTRVDGLHKIFRSEESLRPEEISELLGIEVDIDAEIVPQSKVRGFSNVQFIIVWVISVIVALAGIVFYMHLYEVGLFHPSSEIKIAQ
jgi:hypothetical protein